MTKTEQIESCIEMAVKKESKLSPLALSIPMLGSLRIRHLLNNLGAISNSFLDVGSHVAGSYCSAVYKNDNLKYSAAVDSWESDAITGRSCYQEFTDNVLLCKPLELELLVEKSDCFSVDLTQFKHPFDLYSYDAGHSRSDQKNALVYYKPILADEFIYCCDDWLYEQVKGGTMEGIKEGGYEILHQRELINETPGDGHLNDEWWRSYAVFLLKKKP
jgi:hypothetical protein